MAKSFRGCVIYGWTKAVNGWLPGLWAGLSLGSVACGAALAGPPVALALPDNLPPDTPAFELAESAGPPALRIVPLEPPVMDRGGVYGGWGQGAIGPDLRFYFAIGNHLTSPEADAWLFAYDSTTGGIESVLSTRAAAAWETRQTDTGRPELGDGKLHTAIDFAPDGTTYLLSFYGDYPAKAEWGRTYPGGRLFRYHIGSGQSEFLGVPYPQDSWPMQRWDHRRGVLVGIGERGLYLNPRLAEGDAPAGMHWSGKQNQHSYGSVLVYDTVVERVVYAGLPEDLHRADVAEDERPLRVERRALLLDPDSGRFFSCGTASPTELILIDPAKIRDDPRQGIIRTGLEIDSPLRAGTRRTTDNGELIFITQAGTLYALRADDLTLRRLGPAWTPGVLITDLCLDASANNLYFVVDSTWSGRAYGVPVVRYHLATGQRTVLCFLAPTLFDLAGYCVVGAYTAVANTAGDRLFIQINGHFGEDADTARYEQPVIVDLPIPPQP
ncbi:MAG: hypothetical protein AAF593_00050 [Planctomycetota bacterium]